MTIFAVTCLENVMSPSSILFCLCGNVLIPEDEKNFRAWYTVMHCFLSLLLFFTIKLGFIVRV